MSHQPDNIFAGTQVVSLVEIRGTNNSLVHPRGAVGGPEKSKIEDADITFHESEYQRLRGELQAAHDASKLPELPSEETRAALNDLLVRIRLNPLPTCRENAKP